MALSSRARPSTLRVLVVEDDPFQQMTMRMMTSVIETNSPNLTVHLTLTSSGSAAIGACSAGSEIDLVLLDYKLPGGDADTVLPSIRELVGSVAAIIVLSSSAQEESMQRCWLEQGADSYRLKPITVQLLTDVFEYTLHKQRYLQKRGRADDTPDSSKRYKGLARSALPPHSEIPPAEREASDQYQEAPGILSLLANGRRGPVRLGFAAGGVAVAIKVADHQLMRGPPPADHPYLNRVIKRLFTGGQYVEVRELCEGGEFFDAMLDDLFDGCFPEETVLLWFGRLLAIRRPHRRIS